MKFKPKSGNKEALEQAYQQHEKTIAQLTAMKKLNKKLNEQFEDVKKELEQKNLNINDFIEI
jgi:Tfp pilus assembly protein PilO